MYEEEYLKALKIGKTSLSNAKLEGRSGYLVSLASILDECKISSKIQIGLMEIPLNRIIGTYTTSRSKAFSENFMPLIDKPDSEFKQKWIALYEHHINDGIRDPISVYEYLNYYYVIEGNKRVSVLKYLGAYSICAKVTRIIPKFDENDYKIRLYYKFLEFNKKTQINNLIFSKIDNYDIMLKKFENYNPKLEIFNDKYKHFMSYVYNPFKDIFNKYKDKRIKVNSADALLEFINIYGIPESIDDSEKIKIKKFIKELNTEAFGEKKVIIDPIQIPKKNFLSSITTLIPKSKLKIGYIYNGMIEYSGWTYAQEKARQNIEKNLGEKVTTSYIENVKPGDDAYQKISQLVNEGNDIIFTTHPIFKNDTIRAALDYPNVKFLNCSDSLSFKHVITYYGRMYEPRFLIGLLAGSFTKSNIIGYVAPIPLRETIIDINAFTLGAQIVNPRVNVKVLWNNTRIDTHMLHKIKDVFAREGVDIVCYHQFPAPRANSFQYGLCSMNLEKNTGENFLFSHYANIKMNWNKFYEKFIKLILNGNNMNISDIWRSNKDIINYWLGMDSGVIDIVYSNRYIPPRSLMLVEVFKKMIIQKQFNPFTGPIFDSKGDLKIKDQCVASYNDMQSMTWFVDGVESIDWKI